MPATHVTKKRVEQINQLLKDLRVQPQDPGYTPSVAARQGARFFMTPVVDARQRVVWLKTTLHDAPWLRKSLREEIRVQRAFGVYESRYHPRFDSPSFITTGDDRRGFVWLVRKYWSGVYAGDMTDRFGFSGFFINHIKPAALANVYSDVRKMTAFMRRRISPPSHDYRWFAFDFDYYRRSFWRPFLRHQLNNGWTMDMVDQLEQLLHDHRVFINQQAKHFSHGDMYPNNIMLQPGARRPVVLFDWELSHLNLPAFDSVMVYLHAWRSPHWQAAFKNNTLSLLGNTRSAQLAWRLSVLSLATRLAGFCFIRLTNRELYRYPAVTPAAKRILGPLLNKNLNHLRAVLDYKKT